MLCARGHLLVLLALCSVRGCASTVDLTKGLQLDVVNTGWYDLRDRQRPDQARPDGHLQADERVGPEAADAAESTALFRRVSEADEWGSALISVAGSDGLPPGAASARADHQVEPRMLPAAISLARRC
mgnify:CR=1 FL=1